MRALPLVVGLSMVGTGLLGILSTERLPPDRAVPLSDVARVPVGTKVVVRGFMEDVHAVGAGASIGTITDCAGVSVSVFFPRGASPTWSYTMVIIEGVVQQYRGAREVVVDDPASMGIDQRGALAVTPDEIVEHWPELVCHEVGFTGQVAWAKVSADDPKAVDVAITTHSGELPVRIHLADYPALRVQPGASVTFLGTVAAHPDAGRPIVHVRA